MYMLQKSLEVELGPTVKIPIRMRTCITESQKNLQRFLKILYHLYEEEKVIVLHVAAGVKAVIG